MIWLKAIHIGALAIWCAGLFAMPILFAARNGTHRNEDRFGLQRFTRTVFIAIASPAAFVTVASGTALIFIRPVLEPWFALKLGLVGGLVALHVWTGLKVLHVFLPDGVYRRWQATVALSAATVLVTGILWGVLMKPEIDLDAFMPGDVMEPGRLGKVIRSAYHRLRS